MSQMETRWGKRLGRYEIIAELGRGAMGVVYKARDPKIDRFVAVKTISLSGQNPAEQREYRDRFMHEAQAAGRLLHPGIVTIFDTGDEPESGTAYIVMEYIAGQSLDRMLSGETKKLSLNTALLLTEELAEALDHAHAQGVVHRDMKPSNILMTDEGHGKIADFGIAKLNLAHLTLPGRALGTPAYMSPEQLEGDQVDGRSDLFSLGAILYRMVTGYGPFQGNSATTVCFKVANRDPLRATSLNSDLPPELDAVIARAMAKDPAQRYQRGLEFALDLHELRERGHPQSRGTNDALRFSKAGKGGARTRGDTPNPSANRVPVGECETASEATGRVPSFIPPHVWFWPRMPGVRIGLVVAAIVLTSFAYHQRHPSPGSSQMAVSGGGGLAPTMNLPQDTDHSARRVPNSRAIPSVVADSTLGISIEHHFSATDLSLWVDDKLAFDHSLRGQTKKHWILFRGNAQESETVRVAAGKHRLRVRVRSTPEKYEQSAAIVGSFAKGHQTTLQISFEGQGKRIHLALR